MYIQCLLPVLFVAVSLLLVLYYCLIPLRVVLLKKYTGAKLSKGVSIILYARNDASHIADILNLLQKQDYREFEVVVVDDRSYDDTSNIVREFSEKRTERGLLLCEVKENTYPWQGKKFAITLGVKASNYDYIVMTDTKNIPCSQSWLSELTAPFTNGQTELVLGYKKLRTQGGIINFLSRYNWISNYVNSFGWALCGKAYRGSSSNMACTKELFWRHNGFMNHIKKSIGIDSLFVQENARKGNTMAVLAPLANVQSSFKETKKEWLERKYFNECKEMSHYPFRVLLRIFTLPVLTCAFIVLSGIMFFDNYNNIPFLCVFSGVFIITWIINMLALRKIDTSVGIASGILYDFFMYLTEIFIFFRNKIKAPLRW